MVQAEYEWCRGMGEWCRGVMLNGAGGSECEWYRGGEWCRVV